MKLLSILLLSTSIGFTQTAREREVLKLSERKFAWMQNKQLDSLENILDEKLMYIHSNGWTESKTDLINDIKIGKLVYKQIIVTESNVRIWNNTAVVTGKGIFNVTMDGRPLEINLYYTEVYILENEKWKLLSRHANKF